LTAGTFLASKTGIIQIIWRITDNKNKEKQQKMKAYVLPEVAKRKPSTLDIIGLTAFQLCV
jgi:hypothetical protein